MATNLRPELFEAGPVLQSRSRITANQWGRLEQSRTYLILDEQYESYVSIFDEDAPFRFGQSPPEGAENFLYLQHHQFVKSGHAPSVGIVEGSYVGAALIGSSEFATSAPYFRDHLTLCQVELILYDGNPTDGYQVAGTAQVEYYGVDQEFHYMSRALVVSPLYLSDPYPTDDGDPRHPQPVIRSVAAFSNDGIPIKESDLSWMEVFMTLSDMRREPLRRSYVDEGGVSEGLWDITEEFAVRIRPTVPDELIGIGGGYGDIWGFFVP